MKCQKCGADSLVLATRAYEDVFLRRRRECFNGHVFHTYEVYAANLDRRTLSVTRRGVRARAMQNRKKLRVLMNPDMTATALAKELGITEARVRQIRQEHQDGKVQQLV